MTYPFKTGAYRTWAALILVFSSTQVFSSGNEEPKWTRVSSLHFAVLTDAEEKKAVEVAQRLEQMRAVCGMLLLKNKLTMPEPLDVIALRSYAEYAQLAPAAQAAAQGFFLAGDDRNYIVLNVADEESWLAVRPEFAQVFLGYNYPPTQPWFDEGFITYFSSMRVDNRQATLGADPGGMLELLQSQPWQPLLPLFGEGKPDRQNPRRALFSAESWMVVHYLLNQNKLPETGTYFGLVKNERVPIEQAIQQAYGMKSAQLEQSIREYFRSLHATPAIDTKQGKVPPLPAGAAQSPAPLGPGDIGTSTADVPRPQAQALLAEAMVRVPEHREEAVRQLQSLIDQPITETEVAHRALAWSYFAEGKFNDAMDELRRALDMDGNDPWAHYYFARTKYEVAQQGGEMFPGLANMMQDLRIALDWNTDFAEAYHMLAMARVQGGGINSALDAMRNAIRLNPRNEGYLLDLARVYMAGKKWDSATDLLQNLENSENAQLVAAAKQNLQDLPTLKKYGLMPQHTPPAQAKASKPDVSGAQSREEEESDTARAEPPPDLRKVQFLKGKLLSVNCGQAPAAVLTVASASRTLHLRTEDFKSLLLIGADEFSCDWKNRRVVANYKAGGKSDGDLVSLEVQ